MKTIDILRLLKRQAEKLWGVRILQTLPRGFDFYEDITSIMNTDRRMTIFDIGANTGQSAAPFALTFKNSEIYCFEPSHSNYEKLSRLTSQNHRIHTFKMAIGSSAGTHHLLINPSDSKLHKLSTEPWPGVVETIKITTLDKFCAETSIDRIGILKTDTEGHDLEVLKGADQLLKQSRIDAIYIEAGISRLNTDHIHLEQIAGYLEPRGYHLFGLYEQTPEWKLKKPYLRRVDAAFISTDLASTTQPQ